MKLRSPIIAGVLSILAVTTSAQESHKTSVASVLAVGGRVRLRSTAVQGRPQGLVVALDEAVLTLATDGGVPVKIPLTSITALETSLGRKRNTLKGLGIGAVSGLLLGLALPVDPNNCGYYSSNACSRGEAVSAGAVGFGLVGAGIGALIKNDRWSPVTLNVARPQARHGQPAFGLVLALRF